MYITPSEAANIGCIPRRTGPNSRKTSFPSNITGTILRLVSKVLNQTEPKHIVFVECGLLRRASGLKSTEPD